MPARPLVLLPLVLLLAACGSEPERSKPLAAVRLSVVAPAHASTVDDGTVEVAGRVWPPNTPVLVAGDEAGVSGGEFSATVDLEPGANVIDVEAGAPRRPAAMTAVLVTRRVPVDVPDVQGRTPAQAERLLEAVGLRVRFSRGGGLIDQLLPGTPGACRSTPAAGERVRPGSTVTVEVANVC